MIAYVLQCFTMNEVNRLMILQDVFDDMLTTSLASQRPDLTDRHCRRLLARYCKSGARAQANRRSGLCGNRQLRNDRAGKTLLTCDMPELSCL